ncbi:MAG: RNA methyltransferase [Sterolibacterium sp.]
MKLISSRANPGFKQLRLLAEDAREQRRTGTALLEGAHLVSAYRDKIGLPEQLIVSEHGATQAEIRALCDSLGSVETCLLSDSLFKALSDLVAPTGVAAVIRTPQATTDESRGSCVLLDAVQDAGNVGSILRSAAAVGIKDIYLGPGCAGVWTRRVLRAAQGAHFDLQLHEQADLENLVARFTGSTVAATANAAESLYGQDLSGRVAWLFGSEGSGISSVLEAAVARRVNIPLAAGSNSLNVAAAAAICLFEELRQKNLKHSH